MTLNHPVNVSQCLRGNIQDREITFYWRLIIQTNFSKGNVYLSVSV